MIHTSEGGMTAHQLKARLHTIAINSQLSPSIDVERFIRKHVNDVDQNRARNIGQQALTSAEASRRRP